MSRRKIAIARAVVPVAAAGAIVALAVIALSVALTGDFVFESAAVAGAPEHVSPYFGGVIGAMLTTGLVALMRAVEVLRGPSHQLSA